MEPALSTRYFEKSAARVVRVACWLATRPPSGFCLVGCAVAKYTLCSARRASSCAISGFTGGGGGFSTVTEAEEFAVSPRESVQVALTLTGPVVPAVSSEAVLPEPVSLPLPAVQLATVTGTPSGLLHVQLMLEGVPL